jgi:hypothetical protein
MIYFARQVAVVIPCAGMNDLFPVADLLYEALMSPSRRTAWCWQGGLSCLGFESN